MERECALILLDVNMPGMDGFETASLIHQHPRFEKTPIIFVTAINVSDMDRMRGYKLGAVDYVTVPIIPEILRSKVVVLAELYRKRRDLQLANQHLERRTKRCAEEAPRARALNESLRRANNRLAHAQCRAAGADRRARQRAELRLLEVEPAQGRVPRDARARAAQPARRARQRARTRCSSPSASIRCTRRCSAS